MIVWMGQDPEWSKVAHAIKDGDDGRIFMLPICGTVGGWYWKRSRLRKCKNCLRALRKKGGR